MEVATVQRLHRSNLLSLLLQLLLLPLLPVSALQSLYDVFATLLPAPTWLILCRLLLFGVGNDDIVVAVEIVVNDNDADDTEAALLLLLATLLLGATVDEVLEKDEDAANDVVANEEELVCRVCFIVVDNGDDIALLAPTSLRRTPSPSVSIRSNATSTLYPYFFNASHNSRSEITLLSFLLLLS